MHVSSFTMLFNVQVVMVRFLAQHLNFEANFVQPADQSWGSIDSQGRWSGLVGQAGRERRIKFR